METKIEQCHHKTWDSSVSRTCSHSKDISINCFPPNGEMMFLFFLISLTVLFCYGILNSPYEMFSKDNNKSKQKRKEPKTLEHFDDGKKWIKADLCIVDFLIRLLSSYVHLIAYEIYNTIRFCLIFVCSYINTQ